MKDQLKSRTLFCIDWNSHGKWKKVHLLCSSEAEALDLFRATYDIPKGDRISCAIEATDIKEFLL